MSSTSTRATQWIGFVGDLLRQPLTQMPHEAIVDLIRDTFDVTAASYNWAEADGRQGIIIHPVDTLEPLAEEFLAWQRGEFVGRHPLITWYQTVGDPRPSTNDRVPRAIVSNRERQPLIAMQRPSAASSSWPSTSGSAGTSTTPTCWPVAARTSPMRTWPSPARSSGS